MTSAAAVDLTAYDAWRVLGPYGELQVRDTGVYSGGATEGVWFTLGYLPDDADMVDALCDDVFLRPVGRWARFYAARHGREAMTTGQTPRPGDGFLTELEGGGYKVEAGGRVIDCGSDEGRAMTLLTELSDRPRWRVRLDGSFEEIL